ncbi:hypothetical protein V5799_024298 [Amblyomma americanum]|uniref:C2H2-type domain-containing protein n=1 Tax=Amblyomma americanum TaxID=6943 RepID=A0AAQ4ECY4_AMBAM
MAEPDSSSMTSGAEARKRRRLSAVLDKLRSRSDDDAFSPPSDSSSSLCGCRQCAAELDAPLDLSLAAAAAAHVCSACGQAFAQRDRLAKHVASRHRAAASDGRVYACDVCGRSFARSDMLTRHMRLHTGLKPYTCRVCGQVFSRSDHLSTHQRTHTGEKPYKCPLCPYAACRRDMITRHMRTHARYEPPDSSGSSLDGDAGERRANNAARSLIGALSGRPWGDGAVPLQAFGDLRPRAQGAHDQA